LAVAGVVESPDGKWLVVKKKYGGLKGKWSFPAGFVEPNETLDEAIIREVQEETGIQCQVKGIIGIRSGVIKGEISDNMVIFALKPLNDEIVIQENELYEAKFLHQFELEKDEDSSLLIRTFIQMGKAEIKKMHDDLDPGEHFGYTSYKLFY
jgi:ADP-ribose pyrophosphatase YjhB (NUDIX family)